MTELERSLTDFYLAATVPPGKMRRTEVIRNLVNAIRAEVRGEMMERAHDPR